MFSLTFGVSNIVVVCRPNVQKQFLSPFFLFSLTCVPGGHHSRGHHDGADGETCGNVK